MLVENDYESWKIRIHRKMLDSSSMTEKKLQLDMADNQVKSSSVKGARGKKVICYSAEEKDMLRGSV
ncbi:hypothetical protein Tco_0357599 [Tanacetum coccineum]